MKEQRLAGSGSPTGERKGQGEESTAHDHPWYPLDHDFMLALIWPCIQHHEWRGAEFDTPYVINA